MNKDKMGKINETGRAESDSRHTYKYQVNRENTFTTLRFLVMKHKQGLLGGWAAVITLVYLFPFLPSEIASLIF
jgi:hypothetical protein